jgi:hypothetical protein
MFECAIKGQGHRIFKEANRMWGASKCNLCGDCLVKCLYVDYDKDKAVAKIKAIMEGMALGEKAFPE